jgi:hypothetical protein
VDVEVAASSTRSRYSVSSGVSRAATSESEGLVDRYHLEDEDGDEDHDDDKPNASIKTKKKLSARKSKRDDALKSEVWMLFKFIFFNLLPVNECSFLQLRLALDR